MTRKKAKRIGWWLLSANVPCLILGHLIEQDWLFLVGTVFIALAFTVAVFGADE